MRVHDLSETYIPRYYSQSTDHIQTAISRMHKIPNSKIIRLGQYGGFKVVDRSDPRPEVMPDYALLKQIRSIRNRITEIDKLLRKYQSEYDVYYLSHTKPDQLKKMYANTPFRKLEHERVELKDKLTSLINVPRYIIDD
jgi:hypothetical protein